MKSKSILILEDLGIPKAKFEKLAADAGLPFDILWEESEPENIEGIVTVKTKVDEQLLSKYPNVKFIAVAFTGYDCVDMELCRQKNIAVFNVPTYSTNSVAELALGLAISLLREIPRSNKLVESGEWALKPGNELFGKTVGILGTGTIGIKTAELFKAFGCKIIGYSRTEKEEFKELGKYSANLNELFSSADIISIHLPLNGETKGVVGEDQLSAMKESAYLINTARGSIVDENALANALKENRIAGAAIDVFAQEPIATDNPLLQVTNAILTPHIAYKTEEALERRAKTTIENIVSFAKGNIINQV